MGVEEVVGEGRGHEGLESVPHIFDKLLLQTIDSLSTTKIGKWKPLPFGRNGIRLTKSKTYTACEMNCLRLEIDWGYIIRRISIICMRVVDFKIKEPWDRNQKEKEKGGIFISLYILSQASIAEGGSYPPNQFVITRFWTMNNSAKITCEILR